MKALPDRQSNRLRGYDYALPGAYFVTVVAQGRIIHFGSVVDSEMQLNEVGKMVREEWLDLPTRFSTVQLDEFILMPNHFHGILFLIDQGDVGAGLVPARDPQAGDHQGRPYGNQLGTVIGTFKSITTNRYIKGVKEGVWLPLEKRLWQRDYYDRVIRDEEELNDLREYVRYNALKWPEDTENPDTQSGSVGPDPRAGEQTNIEEVHG